MAVDRAQPNPLKNQDHGLRSRPQVGSNQNQGMKGGKAKASVLKESVYAVIEFHVQANYDEKKDCIDSITDTIGGWEEQYHKYRNALQAPRVGGPGFRALERSRWGVCGFRRPIASVTGSAFKLP